MRQILQGMDQQLCFIEIVSEEKIQLQVKQNTPYQFQGREGGADTSALKI